MKNVLILIITFIAISCNNEVHHSPLSGILWGGEGSRLIIHEATSNSQYSDTILINHQAEFEWNPDSLTDGFYCLSKTSGEKATFYIEQNQPLIIDAQYISYPQNIKITGLNCNKEIHKIEANSKMWHNELTKATSITKSSKWSATKEEKKALSSKIDSINSKYRNQAERIATTPLSKMFALMQATGNQRLFDPWLDRELFFEVESQLNNYTQLKEVKKFISKSSKLKEKKRLHNLYSPGDKFPIDTLETIISSNLENLFNNDLLYVEFTTSENEHLLNSIERNFVLDVINNNHKALIFVMDSLNHPQRLYHSNILYHLTTNEKQSKIAETIGLITMPANFILDNNSNIIAKNITKENLEKILLKKRE
ncbi:hypothetical protein QA597_03700 [Marinilabiliaceae bacterium ANBcel2]|nr:hypothetical protein [Marinilabiliaceae bacterium ANBcel2]